MSGASSNWFEIDLRSWRWLALPLILVSALALLAALLSRWPVPGMLLWLLVAGMTSLSLRRLPRGMLHFASDGLIRFVHAAGDERDWSLHSVENRGPLRVLHLLDENGRARNLPLCRPGNLDSAQLRRLDLWLRRHVMASGHASGLKGETH